MKYSKAEIIEKINSVPNWYHRIDVGFGVITPGIHDSPRALTYLDVPQDCTGKRVLDLGARDGHFAFEMEKRGAEVIAVDYMPQEKTEF